MDGMRILVLADMPLCTRHDRKIANDFDKYLRSTGFVLLQQGVYMRAGITRAKAAILRNSLWEHRPESGSVRMLVLTETQFQASELIAGDPDTQESEIGAQLDIFL